MAYIEREDLITELNNMASDLIKDNSIQCNIAAGTVVEIKDNIVAKQPTADVVEVRHGKWIMRGGRFRCSECDGKALMQDVGGTGGFSHEFEQVKSDICPHCGAKMDGKDGE